MFVKICANTNLHDARLAAEIGADAVGFVFAPSPRQVTVAQVAAITPHLPASVLKVGVFQTQDVGAIADAVRTARLTGVQLHSAPNAALIQTLHDTFGERVRLIQTIAREVAPVDAAEADKRFQARLEFALLQPGLGAVLLDAAKSGASGGLGAAFDWDAASRVVERAYATARKRRAELPKLWLAGGLHAENVREAIRSMKPEGVDVASGVEAEPGKKDPERLRAFMEAARL